MSQIIQKSKSAIIGYTAEYQNTEQKRNERVGVMTTNEEEKEENDAQRPAHSTRASKFSLIVQPDAPAGDGGGGGGCSYSFSAEMYLGVAEDVCMARQMSWLRVAVDNVGLLVFLLPLQLIARDCFDVADCLPRRGVD
ncbi:hypothetical protein PRK78_003422 [Emydomyces testavorans]|uniref:Uncharacterized protein n=1 Tax=Emydomyces testavorans TaxID=2070801 RepID=A0AAF0IHJ7_9EURO|nr:hypothetical protein PRK78_003422 [Emydomyces testavorans]